MTKRRRKAESPRKPRHAKPSDRALNPTVHWLHGLAAMGDEQWEEAIASFERFLDLVPEAPERQSLPESRGLCPGTGTL